MIKELVQKGKGWWLQPGRVEFLLAHLILPLIVFVFYFASFSILYSYILAIPRGVNYDFARRSWDALSLPAAAGLILWIILFWLKSDGRRAIPRSAEKLMPGDLVLLLLPITPVVQYILNNQEILSPAGALAVIAVFVVFSAIYVFAVPALLGFPGSTRIWLSLGLAFVYPITNMASLSHAYAWFEKGSLKIQWLFMGGTFLVTWLFIRLNERKVLRLLVLLVFISNTAMQLMPKEDAPVKTPLPDVENALLAHVEGKNPLITPNIYLLVYDAYVVNETMLAYSFDNSAQEQYLEDLGFTLYPHTYSVDSNSLGTMSKVFNVSTASYGNRRLSVAGNGIVQNALSGYGYETFGIFPSDYFFLNIEPAYDHFYPGRPSSPGIVSRAILMGEFRFDVGFNIQPREQYIQAKQELFADPPRGPIFVYSHSNLPNHSQNSGACLPNETELYLDKLNTANAEMRQDVDQIIANDPEAILIVAGDHGPYLTKNCYLLENHYTAAEISRLDIQDRFGSFLAIKWSAEAAFRYDDITVLQDIFPAIFAYILEDEQILEAKIEPTTISSLLSVQDGIIRVGIHASEPLFLYEK